MTIEVARMAAVAAEFYCPLELEVCDDGEQPDDDGEWFPLEGECEDEPLSPAQMEWARRQQEAHDQAVHLLRRLCAVGARIVHGGPDLSRGVIALQLDAPREPEEFAIGGVMSPPHAQPPPPAAPYRLQRRIALVRPCSVVHSPTPAPQPPPPPSPPLPLPAPKRRLEVKSVRQELPHGAPDTPTFPDPATCAAASDGAAQLPGALPVLLLRRAANDPPSSTSQPAPPEVADPVAEVVPTADVQRNSQAAPLVHSDRSHLPPPGPKPSTSQTPPAIPTAVIRPMVSQVCKAATNKATKSITLSWEPGRTSTDSREFDFKIPGVGRTFPSLAVIVCPKLQERKYPTLVRMKSRLQLERHMKCLIKDKSKLTEWLIQSRLVPSSQVCEAAKQPGKEEPAQMQLAKYSDEQKFPDTGGYIWYCGECQPAHMVPVVRGSILEAADGIGSGRPTACRLVQLMALWAGGGTRMVTGIDARDFFELLRAVCTLAVQQHGRLGGEGRRVEVGIVSLGVAPRCGQSGPRVIKVEVVGALDTEERQLRLLAARPVQEGERSSPERWMELLQPLARSVDRRSVLLTDAVVDTATLRILGFTSVRQPPTQPPPALPNNARVMKYLKSVIPHMFQHTFSMLSLAQIQQFLDELTWRERWGQLPEQAFSNIVHHISQQRVMCKGISLVDKLRAVAENPSADWADDEIQMLAHEENNGDQVPPTVPQPAPSTSSADSSPRQQAAVNILPSPQPQKGLALMTSLEPPSDQLVPSVPSPQPSTSNTWFLRPLPSASSSPQPLPPPQPSASTCPTSAATGPNSSFTSLQPLPSCSTFQPTSSLTTFSSFQTPSTCTVSQPRPTSSLFSSFQSRSACTVSQPRPTPASSQTPPVSFSFLPQTSPPSPRLPLTPTLIPFTSPAHMVHVVDSSFQQVPVLPYCSQPSTGPCSPPTPPNSPKKRLASWGYEAASGSQNSKRRPHIDAFEFMCIECGDPMDKHHFLETARACPQCLRFVSGCWSALQEHSATAHGVAGPPAPPGLPERSRPRRPRPPGAKRPPPRLARPMSCACGFSSALGDKLAKHLVTCAYQTVYTT